MALNRFLNNLNEPIISSSSDINPFSRRGSSSGSRNGSSTGSTTGTSRGSTRHTDSSDTDLPLGFTPDSLLSGDSTSDIHSNFTLNGGNLNDLNDLARIILSQSSKYGTNAGRLDSLISFLTSLYSADRNEKFTREQSDLAYQRQRYETDLAYERTNFNALFNQYLAAGMSPAAAMQAASQSSPDVSGSSPAAGTGQMSPSSAFGGSADMSAVNAALGLIPFIGGAAQAAFQYNKSLQENQRQFNTQHFEEYLTSQGMQSYEPQFKYMYGSHGFVPYMRESAGDFDSTEDFDKGVADIVNNSSRSIPDDVRASAQAYLDYNNKYGDDIYYQAAKRFNFYSQTGVRQMKHLSDISKMNRIIQKCSLHINRAQAFQANFTMRAQKAKMRDIFEWAISTDPAYADSIGLRRNDDGEYVINPILFTEYNSDTGETHSYQIDTLDQYEHYMFINNDEVPAFEFFSIPAFNFANSSDFFSQLMAGMQSRDPDFIDSVVTDGKYVAQTNSFKDYVQFMLWLNTAGLLDENQSVGFAAQLQLFKSLGLYDFTKDVVDTGVDVFDSAVGNVLRVSDVFKKFMKPKGKKSR